MLLSLLLLERGDLDAASDLIEAVDVAYGTAVGMEVLATRGQIAVARGCLEQGLADLLEADARYRASGQQLSVFSDWAPAAAWALSELGRQHEAVELAARELAEAEAFGDPRRYGMALSVCGALSSGERRLDQLREGVNVLKRSPARLEHAKALVRLGTAVRLDGLRHEARDPLAAALELADRCGAVRLAERARAELVAIGARPRRAARTGPRSLTPAELRTARMAAEGLSNRQIAQALFVSAKTVETQLSHAYEKLRVGGRTELSAALGQDPSSGG